MSSIQSIRNELERRKGEKQALDKGISDTIKELKDLKQEAKNVAEAQGILQVVARGTQQELEFHIEEMVSLALSAVFPVPYKLSLKFELKRNKSEAVLAFANRDGELLSPLASSGGGPNDVAAFGLRVALWSLQSPRSRNTLVLDEPFRFVSRDLQERASAMLQEVSSKLGIQMIIVTHEQTLVEFADREFNVSISKGRSVVECSG